MQSASECCTWDIVNSCFPAITLYPKAAALFHKSLHCMLLKKLHLILTLNIAAANIFPTLGASSKRVRWVTLLTSLYPPREQVLDKFQLSALLKHTWYR